MPPLAGDLTILSARSMFLHGRPPTARAGPMMPGAPSLILRGVARQGEQPMAFVEDVGAKQTKQMHVGDAIGPGKLVAITTDGIDRMLGGKLSHVKVGQPIEVAAGGPGGMMPGPTTRPSGIASQGPVDSEPSAANSPPVTATAVADPVAPAEVSTAGAKLIPGHE